MTAWQRYASRIAGADTAGELREVLRYIEKETRSVWYKRRGSARLKEANDLGEPFSQGQSTAGALLAQRAIVLHDQDVADTAIAMLDVVCDKTKHGGLRIKTKKGAWLCGTTSPKNKRLGGTYNILLDHIDDLLLAADVLETRDPRSAARFEKHARKAFNQMLFGKGAAKEDGIPNLADALDTHGPDMPMFYAHKIGKRKRGGYYVANDWGHWKNALYHFRCAGQTARTALRLKTDVTKARPELLDLWGRIERGISGRDFDRTPDLSKDEVNWYKAL